ncbi:CPBP family intramembrane glutamic endopeptidase [Bacillus sp. FJAT-45350]|uniref:CPBP family intramembrane glutamic endopeptidase n=1 Tax=Bacillus sp. FJAT-45350 TaxID=2011014 RepID=UPI000BB70584|nr:CPBP family intramembrane glutamic endopeptidase [Bacillus sp. FJAT-45350]
MKKLDLKISIFLAAICFIAGFVVLPYQLDVLETTIPHQYDEIINSLPMALSLVSIVVGLQLFIAAFILSFIGIKLARKTGFSLHILDAIFSKEKVVINKKATYLSILSGILLGFIFVGADRFYFQNQIPILAENKPEFSLLGLLAGVFYGGVFEEILMRLFLMSLIVWIILKILKRISDNSYWFAIMLTSLLFAAGHLPGTELIFGELTSTIVIRGLLLNSIGGLVFGYLYWKKGLEYAILSHMFAHISMQLLFMPLFY